MSDFMPQDILPKLWDEILKCHWTYFDTEESILKLEKRKKLEECLKEFLCIVQHDRKFFLPETGDVLKKSIQEMDHFSAQNAINAFESISQYANNLFTKPWRKEFRILKMYSGYYQHEIKSNLLDADRLFEAMGYRRLSEDTLILDGPICPDQVTNVSRDAMTAYVELQIIKHIHSVLGSNGINASWLDIFRYREKYTGGISQAIKALTYAIEEKRYRSRDRALTNDNYGYIDVQPSSNYLGSNSKFGTVQCQCHLYQQLPPTARHQPMSQSNGMCCLPEHHQQSSRAAPNLMYSNMSYPAQNNYHHHQASLLAETDAGPLPQMSHSRSLEHYSEPANNHHNMLPHRHSLDHQQQGCTATHQQHPYLRQQQIHQQQQQQHNYQYLNHPHQNFYESPYDCIDGNSLGGGSSSISYAAVAANAASVAGNSNCNMNTNSTYAHPYNVSGNRFPLPLNISNQISAYDNLQKLNCVGSQDPTYAHIGDHYLYSSVARQAKNCGINSGTIQNSSGYNALNQVHGVPNSPLSKEPLPRQRSYQTEQLISFDDPSILPTLTTQQQFDPLHQYQPTYEPSNHIMDKRYMQPVATTCQHYIAGKTATNDDVHVYAKPTPRESRKPFQNSNHLRNPSFNSGERGGDTTDISYESANDELVNLPSQLNERNHLHSPTQFTKNQDGVGSFESWDYVFQNLERSGYSKDLGDRENLLVQSLDLDSLNINNDTTSPSQASSAEKRRSNYAGNENKNAAQHQQPKQQQLVQLTSQADTKQNSQTFKNTKPTSKNNTKMDMITTSSSVTSNPQKQRTLADNNEKKIKSALKQTNATSKSNPNPNKAQQKINDNKSSAKTLNNNNNETFAIFENGTTARKKSSTSSSLKKSSQGASVTSNAAPSPPPSTQIIVTGANEWSCTYCTFINPNTRRICEMCCRTKDNKLDATSNSTAAGTTAVAHNTTTCA